MVPQAPLTQWTETAPTGSSILAMLSEELNREDTQHAGDDADDGGARRVNHVAACGDGHQAGQSAVEGQGHIGFAVADPGGDQAAQVASAAAMLVLKQIRPAETMVSSPVMLTVEPPLKPNQQNHRMKTPRAMAVRLWPGMARALPSLPYLPIRGTQHPGAQAGGEAAHEVDCGGTGEIVEAQLAQPAAAPDPVARDGVDDQADGCRVNAVGAELGALSMEPETMVAAVAQNTVWNTT